MSTLTLLIFCPFCPWCLVFVPVCGAYFTINHKNSNDVNCSLKRSYCSLNSKKKTEFAFEFATSCAIVFASVSAFAFTRTLRELRANL